MRNKKYVSFTLAEVLVVLAILGIIAAITIPVLMQSVQDQELKTAWKKEYSVIESAAKLMYNDNGGDIYNLTNDDDSSLLALFAPYLLYSRQCPEHHTTGKCWHNDDQWRYLNNQIITDTGVQLYDAAGLILNDGTLLKFLAWGPGTLGGQMGYILVDVNGFKHPNIVGRDIFLIMVNSSYIKPAGYGDVTDTFYGMGDSGTCDSSKTGYSCSSEYLYK